MDTHAIGFVIEMARALHRYGTPAHRLEEAMALLCRRLEVAAAFFATPTAIFAFFDTPSGRETILVRTAQGGTDLGKLTQLDRVIHEVATHARSPAEGEAAVAGILAAKPRPGVASTIASAGVASATAAVFLGGSGREFIATGAVGVMLGFLSLLAGRFARIGQLYEMLGGVVVGFVVVLASAWWGPLSIQIATIAGLITLLPGLALTVAMTELATGHLVSGTSRLMGALVSFVMLGLGVALGNRAASAWFEPVSNPMALPPPAWATYAALAATPFALAVLFRARGRDFGWIWLACIVAFAGARLGARWMGPELGMFLGALALGVASNVRARLLDVPAGVTLVPGLMLLVPGSLGFRSLSSLLARDVVSGLELAFTAVMIAAALVAGLLAANVLVRTQRSL
jgi:uncharacterized membrane protein YjjP (DUF1212 family)